MRVGRRQVLKGLGVLALAAATGAPTARSLSRYLARGARFSTVGVGRGAALTPGLEAVPGIAGFTDRLAELGVDGAFEWTAAPAGPHQTMLLVSGFKVERIRTATGAVTLLGRRDPAAVRLLTLPTRAFYPHPLEGETVVRTHLTPAGVPYQEAVRLPAPGPQMDVLLALEEGQRVVATTVHRLP